MLTIPGPPSPVVREDPLPIDPEPARVILPGQPTDENGLNAMQPLIQAEPGSTRFLVPLPPGLSEDSPDLFGIFTYEFRAGHDNRRWSTARGRFGPPLRVTGVQHPAPPLNCYVNRTDKAVEASAPFAQAVAGGVNQALSINTEIWFLLYTQVREASGASWRNVLLKRLKGNQPDNDDDSVIRYASAEIPLSDTAASLNNLSLAAGSPLSVLAVELLPAFLQVQVIDLPPDTAFFNRYRDPLGSDLGQVRILRTSALVPVPAAC